MEPAFGTPKPKKFPCIIEQKVQFIHQDNHLHLDHMNLGGILPNHFPL